MKQASLITKLRKLRTMSERGTPHEAATARTLFDMLCQQYHIQPADLLDIREDRWFNYQSEFERKLLLQIVGRVTHENTVTISRIPGTRKVAFSLTEGEAIEVKRLYTIYRKDLRRQLQQLFQAFVQANNIFSGVQDARDDLTAEEIANLRQLLQMAETIPVSNVRKGLAPTH